MSFRFDQCKEDAHMFAETCKVFAQTLEPRERADFYSTLVPEIIEARDAVAGPGIAIGHESVTEIVREMSASGAHQAWSR